MLLEIAQQTSPRNKNKKPSRRVYTHRGAAAAGPPDPQPLRLSACPVSPHVRQLQGPSIRHPPLLDARGCRHPPAAPRTGLYGALLMLHYSIQQRHRASSRRRGPLLSAAAAPGRKSHTPHRGHMLSESAARSEGLVAPRVARRHRQRIQASSSALRLGIRCFKLLRGSGAQRGAATLGLW